jgi:hypothetical protein
MRALVQPAVHYTRQARPLRKRDVKRLMGFFDEGLSAAYAFARSVWLPDATRTLIDLEAATRDSSSANVAFLTDHLREGARSVGAYAYMQLAGEIDGAVRAGLTDFARRAIADGLHELSDVDAWLERRSRAHS